MNKPSVYLETSVISYYTARPARDIHALSHQESTRIWWEKHAEQFDVVISTIVLGEIRLGDPAAAAARMKFAESIRMLEVSPECVSLAAHYSAELGLPERAKADALHISVATIHEVDFLVTWNCTHIAGAFVRRQLDTLNNALGLRTPTICTPEEMLDEYDISRANDY